MDARKAKRKRRSLWSPLGLMALVPMGCSPEAVPEGVLQAEPASTTAAVIQSPPDPSPLPRGALRERWRQKIPLQEYTQSVLCTDLNGDGKAEILVRGRDGAIVLDAAGRKQATFPLGEDMQTLVVCQTPNGPRIIGFTLPWGQGVEARDTKGKHLWRYEGSREGIDGVCTVDIQDPEGDAIAVGYNGAGGVRVIGADGKLRWHATEGLGNVWNVAAARLERDAPASVLCTQSAIWVYNARGEKVKEIGNDSDAGYVYGADLDGDGRDEVFGLGTTQVSGLYLSVYSADGTRRWRQRIPPKAGFLGEPIVVGRFWPSGRQAAARVGNDMAILFQADGKPLSLLKVSPNLRAMAALPRGNGAPDALVALTEEGVVCYEWKAGKESPIPTRLTVPPPAPPEPPLLKAVLNNDLPAVQTLLAKGADPNSKNSQGSQALVVAVNRGFTTIAQALLDKGANPNVRSKSDSTPLLEAIKGHTEIVKALLSRGAKVDEAHTRGFLAGLTPLIGAAMSGHNEIVQLLLEHGAKPGKRDSQGHTALHWAAGEGHVQIAEMLLARGAEVDARNWVGTTPLMMAAMVKHVEMVKFLIGRGANVNARVDSARSLYMAAQFTGAKATQKRLEESGKLKVRREDGKSVLASAKIGNSSEVIELLKKAGARE